jgi:hypothetical protein
VVAVDFDVVDFDVVDFDVVDFDVVDFDVVDFDVVDFDVVDFDVVVVAFADVDPGGEIVVAGIDSNPKEPRVVQPRYHCQGANVRARKDEEALAQEENGGWEAGHHAGGAAADGGAAVHVHNRLSAAGSAAAALAHTSSGYAHLVCVEWSSYRASSRGHSCRSRRTTETLCCRSPPFPSSWR